MSKVVYSDNSQSSVSWLNSLMQRGFIRPGKVIHVDIQEFDNERLRDTTQYHAFAGIGGWARALELAGWPKEEEVWTGSCPCQPFSAAARGLAKGTKDEKHLWPTWRSQVKEFKPPVIFGEQVSSPAGRDWMSYVRTDLEEVGYEVGVSDLCAAGVGAPHARQRIFFGAVANRTSLRRRWQHAPVFAKWGDSSKAGRGSEDVYPLGSYANVGGFEEWANREYIFCRDSKIRPIECGTLPVDDGVPNRVELIRGYGNAIVPRVAALFIQSFVDVILEELNE